MSDELFFINPVYAVADREVGEEPDAVLGPNCPVCGKALTRPLLSVLKTTEATRTKANSDGKLEEVPTALHALIGRFGHSEPPCCFSDNENWWQGTMNLGMFLVILGTHPSGTSIGAYIGWLMHAIGAIWGWLRWDYKKHYPRLLDQWEAKEEQAPRLFFCRYGTHVFDPTTGEVLLG